MDHIQETSAITLKDISKKMNISMTSVHRAIYGKEGVSETLRRQVLETAREMGYKPNYAASSMKRKPVQIAVVLPSPEGMGALYYAYFWKGYRKALKEIRALNVKTDEYPVEGEEDQIRVLKKIADEAQHTYSAVMTFSYTHNQDVLRQYERLTAKNIAVMVLDDCIEGIPGLYCIPSNDKLIGEMCGEVFSLMVPEEGTLLVSSGRQGSMVHKNTIAGLKKYLSKTKSRLKVELLPYSEDAYEGFCQGIRMYDDLVGTFALIARETEPMVRALKDTRMREKVRAMGADLNQESAAFLQEGMLDVLVYKNPYDKGMLGFVTLIDCVVKHTEPPQNIQCAISMVFKTSLNFYENVIKL